MLVSSAFDGVPWLERVYQAANLWDTSEMGDVGRRALLHARRARAQGVQPAAGAQRWTSGVDLLTPARVADTALRRLVRPGGGDHDDGRLQRSSRSRRR